MYKRSFRQTDDSSLSRIHPKETSRRYISIIMECAMKVGFLMHFRKKRHTLHLCACAFALRKAVIQLQLVQGHFWGCAISGGIYIYIQEGIKQHGFPHNNQTDLFD